MNSFQTIATHSLSKIIKIEYKDEYKVGGKHTLITLERLSKMSRKELNNILVEENETIGILEGIIKLANLTHTLGNFILVPTKTFNSSRYAPTKDFFDLTLEGIRQYYLNECHTPMCSLWCEPKNVKWLNKYLINDINAGEKSWQNFINSNLLNDYIENKNGKYMVKYLFKNHSFARLMPKTLDEILNCINNMCKMIELRGKRIYNAINNTN